MPSGPETIFFVVAARISQISASEMGASGACSSSLSDGKGGFGEQSRFSTESWTLRSRRLSKSGPLWILLFFSNWRGELVCDGYVAGDILIIEGEADGFSFVLAGQCSEVVPECGAIAAVELSAGIVPFTLAVFYNIAVDR